MSWQTRTHQAEYDAWRRMQNRCYDPKDKDFKHYGARGVTVCQAWRENFLTFLADVGQKPERNRLIWLGRLDLNGNYEPGNVAWVKHQRQISHRRYCHRIPCGDRTLTIQEAGRELGLSAMTLRQRLLGQQISLERAVTPDRLPYRKDSHFLTHNGETLSVPEWAKRLGVRVRTLRERLRRQVPLERALRPGNLRYPDSVSL